jgi:hypothetical protein
MTHVGHTQRKSLRHRIPGWAIFLCFLASCAVYDAPPLGSAGAPNGGRSGAPDIAAGGGGADDAAVGGTGPTSPTGGAGVVGGMYAGGADAGSSGAAGSPDGGAADGGAGGASGGNGGHAGDATSGNGGGGTTGSGPLVELSRNRPAIASSQQAVHDAASGNDGDSVTRWCSKGGTFPQWWRVDLGATHSLKEFKISFEYSDRKYYYDIETSADDSAYTLQARASGTAALQSGLFPAGVSARYVRITVTNADPAGTSQTWASFFEFVVTGT